MRTAVFLALAILLVAACQREAPAGSANTPIPPETDNPAARPTPASPTQEVHLMEYAIHMPDTMAAGKVAFNVENGGKEKHAFEVEGNGVHAKTVELTAGNTAALEVDLEPGTYTIYCPVGGHRGKGMEKKLVVQ